MSYGTTAGVQALTGRISIGTGSTPTTTQVQGFVDGRSAEIDMHLGAIGYAVPVTAPAYFVTWLGLVNAWGAAALALKAFAPEQVISSAGGPVIPAYAYYEKLYDDALKAIDDREVSAPDAAMGTATLARSYLTDNPENDPLTDGSTEGQQPAFSMGRNLRDF